MLDLVESCNCRTVEKQPQRFYASTVLQQSQQPDKLPVGNKPFHTYSFEKLDVWQLARRLRKEIYLVSGQFPKEELFGLTSQIRRSTNSISDNLAEGSGRATNYDKAKFTNISYTSALETVNHLIGAYDLEYIGRETYTELRTRLDEIINKLNGLYKYQLKDEGSLKKRL